MRIHIVNPSHFSFGVSTMTPRWLYVLAAATPSKWGDPVLSDEMLEAFDTGQLGQGDIIGIGIHTGNALVGYQLGQRAHERGAWVVYGGIHATLYPEEAHEQGGANAVVRGDGDIAWGTAIEDCANGEPKRIYEGGSGGRRQVSAGPVGSAAAREVCLGVGADGAGLSQALLVLLGVAHRRTGAPPTGGRPGH